MAARTGTGLCPRNVMQRFPLLPLEEEGRLNDMPLRENFIERILPVASARQGLLPLDEAAGWGAHARRAGQVPHGAQADADGPQPKALHRDGPGGSQGGDDPLGRAKRDLVHNQAAFSVTVRCSS